MHKVSRKQIVKALGILLTVLGLIFLRNIVFEALKLFCISTGIALLISPLCSLYEKKIPSTFAALLSIATIVLGLIFIIFIIAYPLANSIYELFVNLPAVSDKLTSSILPMLKSFGLGASMPEINISDLPVSFGDIFSKLIYGAFDTVGTIADIAIATVVAWYMLTDRNRLLLRLELLIPSACRSIVISGTSEAKTEILMYLRGQSIIAACVGILSVFGLFIVGIPNSIPLGLTAGILNMIPYIGPFVACIPVGAVALTQGFIPFLLSIGVLIVVQQIDGLVLSPRIVGSSTGFAPAAVMIAIFASGAVWGAFGMLLALPGLILIRTCVRVFVELRQNC